MTINAKGLITTIGRLVDLLLIGVLILFAILMIYESVEVYINQNEYKQYFGSEGMGPLWSSPMVYLFSGIAYAIYFLALSVTSFLTEKIWLRLLIKIGGTLALSLFTFFIF